MLAISRPLLALAAAVWLLLSWSGRSVAGEPPKAPTVRAAVLDLNAPEAAPWLGPAVAESLAAKLAGVDGVVLLEREKVQTVLRALEGKDATPGLLGVEYLLTGAIQLAGPWAKETKIRISAKVAAAETAKIQGDAAFVEDGTVGEIFEMESRLAEKFAKALGKEAPALQIDYHEEKNLLAKKLFGEGLLKLQEAEALLAQIEDSKKKAEKPEEGQPASAPKDEAKDGKPKDDAGEKETKPAGEITKSCPANSEKKIEPRNTEEKTDTTEDGK